MNVTVELADLRALQERVEALEECLSHAIAYDEAGREEQAKALLATSEQWERQEQAAPVACPKCANENVRTIAVAEGSRVLLFCPACGTTWEARGGQPA